MRILVVTPYPPQRDGIANYAAQSVAGLMREGHEVVVLSLQPSAAHLHLDFMRGPRSWAALARRVRGFDRLVIQWHPAFFYRSISAVDRSKVDLAAAAVFRLVPDVEVWVHEYEYDEVRRSALRRRSALTAFSQVDRVVFHSQKELDVFRDVVPVPRTSCVVEEHGQAFSRRTSTTREAARTSLGIDPSEFVFLCIGFIQRHKGFDRGVRALSRLEGEHLRLHVVGSTRLEEPEFVAYLDELQLLTDQDPRATLHAQYVSDELFDRWIHASDVVLLPYRQIWSSGVLERAALFDRPVIATRVGSLEEQSNGRDVTFVDDDDALVGVMAEAAGSPVRTTAPTTIPTDGSATWSELQELVVERAAAVRGVQPGMATALPVGAARDPAEQGQVDRAARMVRRLPAYGRPPATSTRPGVSAVKKLIQRSTSWQIDPLASKVDQLQAATANSLEIVARELARLTPHTPSGDGPDQVDGARP